MTNTKKLSGAESDSERILLLCNNLKKSGIAESSVQFIVSLYHDFKFDSFVIEKYFKSSRVDLSFTFNRCVGGFDILLEKLENPKYRGNPLWRRVIKTIQYINDSHECSNINEIWLEFDEEREMKNKIIVPGLYLNICQTHGIVRDFCLKKIMNLLGVKTYLQENSGWFSKLPGNLKNAPSLLHFGIFIGRKPPVARLVYFMELSDAVEIIRMQERTTKLVNLLSRIKGTCDRKVLVHFNVMAETIKFQGIEIYSKDSKNWKSLISFLATNHWIDYDQKKLSLVWPGEYYLDDRSENLIKNAAYCRCEINHLKILHKRKIGVKLYLFASFRPFEKI